jgi:hypothetical protein
MTSTITRHETSAPRHEIGSVAARRLPPIYDDDGQPTARLELCPAGGEPVEFDTCELGVALELSGMPLRPRMDPHELACLALLGLANAGRPRLRELSQQTRQAALKGMQTGDWREHDRVTRGRQDALANLLKLDLFSLADRQGRR